MAKTIIHGIALRSGGVEYTTLTAGKEGWEITAQDAARLSPAQPVDAAEQAVDESAEPPDPHQELLSQLKPVSQAWKPGLASVSLPADRVLLRVVDLPTIDPDEILSMVDYQIEKFSPFPIDSLTVSYEVLAETENSSRVLIVGAKNKLVDELGDLFHELGVTVRWIDVDVLGWWHWLSTHEKVAKFGREAMLLDLEDGMVLVVSQNGVPLTMRAIHGLDEVPAEERHDVIAEEIEFTLTSLEAEWGGVDHTQYSLWSENDVSIGLAQSLGQSLSMDLATGTLRDLPPLSHALADRAVDRPLGRVDLAPPDWESSDLARTTQKNLIVASAGVAGVCLLALLGIYILAGSQKAGLDRLRTEREAIVEPAAEVRDIREQVKKLRKFIDSETSSLEVLRAISMTLPDGVDLSAFTYNRNGNVTIRGEANQENPIYKFVEKLLDTGMFDDVKLDRVESKRRNNVRKSVFRISAKMKEADA